MKRMSMPNTLSHMLIALFLFVLILMLFSVYIFNGAPLWEKVRLSEGSINLSQTDKEKKVYLLQGEWEFYPDALYTYEDFQNKNTNPPLIKTFPDYWKTHGLKENGKSPLIGYGTYRAKITLPKDINNIGIYARYQFSAAEIFIDGIRVCGNGNVSRDLNKHNPNYAPSTGYIINHMSTDSSPASIKASPDKEVDVIVWVENLAHAKGGFVNGIYFGSAESIRSLQILLLFFNAFVSGGLFMMVVYFFMVYSHNHRKKEYIDYSIVSVFAFFVSLTTGGEALLYQLSGYLPWFDSMVLLRIEYCSLIIGSFFANYRHIKALLKDNKKWLVSIYGVIGAIVILQFTLPIMILTSFSAVNACCAAVIFIIPLIHNVKSFFVVRTMDTVLSTISYLFIFGGLISFFSDSFPWSSVDLFSYSLLFHCAIQMMILLRRYGKNEEELLTLTQTLETRIEERTSELRRTKEKAEAATDAKSDFLATMSHEIRTPLNAIIGMSALISTDNMDGIQQRYFNDIQRTSKSLLQIINDVLDFSKIEAGKLEITKNHFNIFQLYDNLSSITAFSAEAKGLEFKSDFDPAISEIVYADEVRYRQIVMNILNNAVKYTKEGGVEFKVYLKDNMLCFEVGDTGIGIKEEDKGRIFGSFEQLDKAKNQKIVGTGLGLSITKRLISMIGGRIEFDSVYEKGTVFYIYLPYVKGDASKVEKIDEYDSVVAMDDASVLVVDDNSINLTVALGFLSRHNIAADTAQSGETAIEMVQLKQYDIIFMDHMMPGMDGVETTHAIRKLGEKGDIWLMQVPIIALTANAVSGAREMLIKEGMDDFLSKPISAAHLNAILNRWLPKEKLSYAKGITADKEMLNDSQQDLLLKLETIEGLMVYDALDNMEYNIDVYFGVLTQFCNEAEHYSSEINRHLEAEDWKNYTIKVHAIKGIFANMGAKTNAEFAYELELAGREGDISVIIEQTPLLFEMITELKNRIGAIDLSRGGKDNGKKIKPALKDLTDRLHAFIEAATYWDSNAADQTADWLEGITYNERVDSLTGEIITSVRSIDYDVAVEKARVCLGVLADEIVL